MTRNGRAQLRQSFRKLREAFELARFLKLRVICVIEILPTPRCVFTDRLQPSLSRGIDGDVSPCRRDSQSINPIEIRFRQTATYGSIAKPTLRTTETANSDLLKSFEISH